ncbi:MAG: HD domain-containing protein [Psychroflexus halocasei]|uniref:HD domain-containing protein n=1 Tax=Psychroflexus sp. S27 TaxID=1982757 RepID=UPI000C29FCFE|nr:HD domain-containing protein [Psychroflexus sp. S27]PJX27492.1 phosphohydrolase [Psychroflexus sp. S27]
MSEEDLLKETREFVKIQLSQAESGHDWYHIKRVYHLALHIAKQENYSDLLLIKLGALLHDIADAKFHDGDEEIGPKIAGEFLQKQDVNQALIDEIALIIKHISFKNSSQKYTSQALEILQDADRLDAIGAIGIARTFNYGGYKNREIYNPDIPPQPQQTKTEYKKSTAPTINHFYEKLLLLKDQMNTKTGFEMAKERHDFMMNFLAQFYEEWNFSSE